MNPSKPSSILSRVVESISQTTRYPVELLTPSADLENDLGIDSVKRLEIVVGLSEEFSLALESERPDPSIRTIADIADWIGSFLPEQSAVATLHAAEPSTVPPPKSKFISSPAAARGQEVSKQTLRERAYSDDRSTRVTPAAVPSWGSGLQEQTESQQGDRNGHSATDAKSDTNQDSFRLAQPHLPLHGRIALVTGSGRGVGRVTARLLASKGATVIVNSFHSRSDGEQTAADINAAGGTAIHVWGSVANPEHVDHLFGVIEEQFGRLDILICNASDGRIGSFMDLTEDDWERAFRTNVTGHHRCAVRAAGLMRIAGGGSIVTMSAVGANGYIEGLGSQGVVKAAVETMTRYLACELGQFGIRVNCVAGGPVYGDLLSKFNDSRLTQSHWESITADGSLCSPIDLANAIGFLVSEEARGITGSVWMVDHGFSAIADGRPLRFAARTPVGAAS